MKQYTHTYIHTKTYTQKNKKFKTEKKQVNKMCTRTPQLMNKLVSHTGSDVATGVDDNEATVKATAGMPTGEMSLTGDADGGGRTAAAVNIMAAKEARF